MDDNNVMMLNHSDIKEGDLLTLRAVSGHGKNRISQHGDTWRVTCNVSQTTGNLGLESLEETFGGFLPPNRGLKVKDQRWVKFSDDCNFVISAHTRGDDLLWAE
jgi:hypothetical protein